MLSRATFFYSVAVPFITNNSFLDINVLNAPQASLLSKERNTEIMRTASRLVREKTSAYMTSDPSMAGPLLRLAFHDGATREQIGSTFTGGPNGSIRYELQWNENRGISKPLEVVDNIYYDIDAIIVC